MKNKKVVALVGALAVVVVGVSIFVFAPKDSGSAEVAQEVVEAVETPTIEIPEEVVEEPEVVEEVEEVPEVEVAEEPEVVEEVPEVEETTEVEETSEPEESIVEVTETSPEVSEGTGVDTKDKETSNEVSQVAEPKQEEVKPAETKPVETQPVQTQPQQTTVDAQRDAILAQMKADGAIEGIPDSNFEYGNYTGNAGAGLQWE